jgi:serine/threonine protein kinase
MSGSSVGEDVTVFDFIELLQASDWVSSPVYAGWLQKKSKGWLVSSLFTQFAWQPKWVSLHGLELIYMDEEPTNENIASISIRRTSIGSTTKIMPYCEEDRQDPLAFSIQPDCTKPRVWQFRAESEEEKTNWLIKISQVHAIAAWLDSYTKEKVLGVGAQGTVYEIVHKSTGQRYAMKEVNIENEKQMQMAITEAKLLKEITKNVCHPCIMQIEKVFQVVDKFYLVFPLCTGGELYDAVVRRGHFTERKAARIIRDVISALQALHEYNVLHLDIKPENILFESDEPNARVKITDFGLSKIFTPETVEIQNRARPTNEELAARAESFINCGNFNADHVRGTFGYMSPELILSGARLLVLCVYTVTLVVLHEEFCIVAVAAPTLTNRPVLRTCTFSRYSRPCTPC